MNHIPIEGRYLIKLLASVLHGENPTAAPVGLEWQPLYQLAAYHSVANTVYYPLEQLKQKPPETVRSAFLEARNKAVVKEAKQELEVARILAVFEQNQIKCMPLKGYLIKHLYPKPDMRLMADVDILLQEGDLEKAKPLMLSLGYDVEHLGGNHDVYYKRPVMNIELHRALISAQYEKLYDYYGDGWQFARLKDSCKYIHEMSKEDFYIFLMVHLAKHCQCGGTGIRSIMDVWVYMNRYRTELDWNYIDGELNKMDLLAFTKNIEKLSACWFDGLESCELFDKMTAFIVSNGTYGLNKNSTMVDMMKNNANKSFKIAKVLYTLRLFFPARKTMVILFPVLNKLPFLLPLTWVLRGLICVIFRPQNIVKNLSCVASVNKQDAQNLQQLHQKAGLPLLFVLHQFIIKLILVISTQI